MTNDEPSRQGRSPVWNQPVHQPLLPIRFASPTAAADPKGVVYTKPWVVELLLDLAGYSMQSNLVS